MAAACSLGILEKVKALISHGFDKDFLLDSSDRSYAVSCARGACFRFPLLVPSAVQMNKSLQLETKAGLYEVLM